MDETAMQCKVEPVTAVCCKFVNASVWLHLINIITTNNSLPLCIHGYFILQCMPILGTYLFNVN